MATSSAGMVIFNGCRVPQRELLMQSPLRMPEDMVTGLDNWYSSICRQCPAGCGIVVRVMEGRAKKIEGNPDYPVNQGKLCARGISGVQVLYHPDRIREPMKRTGQRGSDTFKPITWDEALDELGGRLKELRTAGNARSALMVTEPLRGHLALVVDRFVSAYGGKRMAFEALDQTTVYTALKNVFGQDMAPDFDIQNSRYILSFGADFLETWLSPVRYSRGYGEFRQGRPDSRGTLVQIEPRFSTTGASADEWVPIRPGTEGLLALSMAQVIISEGLGDSAAAAALTGGAGASALSAYSPETVSAKTGVPAERIKELSRAFARQRPSLAIGGTYAAAHTNGVANLTAIYALNFLVGSVGTPGGVLLNPQPPLETVAAPIAANTIAQWEDAAKGIISGASPVNLLMVHGANPSHGLPGSLKFDEVLSKVPYIVSFSSFMDETTAHADLILPDHTYLESWGDDAPNPGPGYQVLGIQQPVVNPLYTTRAFADVLLTIAEEIGDDTRQALPWNTFHDLLKEQAGELYKLNRGSVKAPDVETFWIGLLQRGGWWDTQSGSTAPRPQPPVLPTRMSEPEFSGSEREYPYNLVLFPSISLTDGRGANLPWLQSTPDPLTTVMWQTWLEMNPRTASQVGVAEGDVVVVESPHGRLEVPVYILPAIPPDVVAMPLGQGHTSYGRWAEARGVNPLSIVAPMREATTGSLAWEATRVRVTKTSKKHKLPKLEGTVPAIEQEEFPIAQVTPA
ncbi:MAG: molybdopterin oxidoreductase [Dehalococcoidia bacterium]|nr:molybdopterin oxidoreductase [Dehalococcoidia bacterium]